MALGNVSKRSALALSSSSIRITWNAATEATGYIVYRSFTENGGYSEVGRTSKCEYIDRELAAETLYYYKIRPYNAGGNGGYSGAVGATTLAASELGFIEKNILDDLRNAIRENTGMVEKVYPVEMPGLVRSIGGRAIYRGSFLGAGDARSYSLGVSLPTYANYTFLIMPQNPKWGEYNYNYYCGRKTVIGNITSDYLRTHTEVVSDGWNIDFENGTIQNDFFNPAEGAQYTWWYFEEYLTSASAEEYVT